MTKILIKLGYYGVHEVYSDCPNVEVKIQNVDEPGDCYSEFKDGVNVEDFAVTQNKVY